MDPRTKLCHLRLSHLYRLSFFLGLSSYNYSIVKILKRLTALEDKNITIVFTFVGGNPNVLGNEWADRLAKAATKREVDIAVNIPKSFYIHEDQERKNGEV
ncbi:hypothetical protein TNCV_1061271 [Trichonephila clavipes]|nr:hypothetical protein TNCV_1061271 [Trichonephila clavipes]